jgi:hypothetical protein
MKPSRATQTIILAGLLAGTLDALAAIIQVHLKSNIGPLPIFRFIASGVFGQDAFAGGVPMALWGILFHYVIAMSWTALLFFLYPYLMKVMNKFVIGFLYGIVIWLMMNLVILPLSNIPKGRGIEIESAVVAALILIIAIGIPVSLIFHRYYTRRTHV